MANISDQMWKRHANPWSVWTRFAAIPAFILAVWSRVWLGGWALVPVAVVMAWLILNVFVFPPVDNPISWVSKGIYGEQLWLKQRKKLPRHYDIAQRWLIVLGVIGMSLIVVGLVILNTWLCAMGCIVVTLAQLWRIDRFSLLYDLQKNS